MEATDEDCFTDPQEVAANILLESQEANKLSFWIDLIF